MEPIVTKWDKILNMHVDNPNAMNKIDPKVFRKQIRKWNELIQRLIKKE